MSSELTRRGLMGSAAAAGLVLAGCGGGNENASAGGAPTGERRAGGTFRLGDSQMSGSTSADPQSRRGTSFMIARARTNSLVERDQNFKLRNALAEEFEPDGDDMQTWTIRVKDGVEFHNGKTLGAEDVIYSIRRNVNPKAPGFTSGLMVSIDLDQMKKLDKRTVRLRLKYPNSQLRDSFAEIP